MPSVLRHSYIKGRNMGKRARAHLNYIVYRPGDDREAGGRGREFRSNLDEDAGTSGYLFRQALQKETGRNDVVHKLMLSPGHNDVDMDAYVKEIMGHLGRAKGQDLRYGYVVHDNTDHQHAHVILLGRDCEDGLVRLSKLDHMAIRAWGDRYLEREHSVERQLDYQMEQFARQRGLNIGFQAERGHEFYKLLDEPKGKDKQAERDTREWEWIDEKWKQALERPEYEPLARLGKTSFHDLGRQAELAQLFRNNYQQQLWQDIHDNSPQLQEAAKERLETLAEQRQEILAGIAERTQAQDGWKLIDTLSKEFTKEARELHELLNPQEPREWERGDVDAAKVADEDKIVFPDGTTYTKYDRSDELLKLDRFLKEFPEHRLDKEDYSRLWSWIGNKDRYGEDVYGQPPLKPIEHELVDRELAEASERDEPERPLDLDKLGENARQENSLLQQLLSPKIERSREIENEMQDLDRLSDLSEPGRYFGPERFNDKDFQQFVSEFLERGEIDDARALEPAGERHRGDDFLEQALAGQEDTTTSDQGEGDRRDDEHNRRDRGDDITLT